MLDEKDDREATSASVVNGIIFVIGCVAPGGVILNLVEAYDPDTDTWTEKRSMQYARWSLSTCVVKGKIYAMGGGRGERYIEEYGPATDTRMIKADRPIGLDYFGVNVVEGIIYTIGGGSGPGCPYSRVIANDPVTYAWSEKTIMQTSGIYWSAGHWTSSVVAVNTNPIISLVMTRHGDIPQFSSITN